VDDRRRPGRDPGGAGWPKLRLHAAVLWGMALGILLFSTLHFCKRQA
jgi:hypothetical protein